jgi:hypothetical protein
MADTPSGILSAADRIRETAKWLTISLATLGGVLIAGTQLSDIGKLQQSSSRFAVAVIGDGITAVAAVTILAFAIWVATTPAISLTQLANKSPRGLRDIVGDPLFLDGKNNVRELAEAYRSALDARNAAFVTLQQQKDDPSKIAAEAADAQFVSLSDTVGSLLDAVAYKRLAYRWKRAGGALLSCGVLAAAGIGAFAWAAKPPDKVVTSMATPSVLTTPSSATVTLTAQGRSALRNALGSQCPITPALRAVILGDTDAGPDVLIQQTDCNMVRFIAVSDWASVLKR